MRRMLISVGAAVCTIALMAACDGLTEPGHMGEIELTADSEVENGHATGGVSVVWDAPNRSRGDIDLDAHEGAAESEERGTFEWEAYDANGALAREMTITVQEIDVTGTTAKFVAVVTFDSWDRLLGQWYAFYAEDGGSPGVGNDEIQWTNSSTRSGLPAGGTLDYGKSDLPDRFTIVSGNLSIRN